MGRSRLGEVRLAGSNTPQHHSLVERFSQAAVRMSTMRDAAGDCGGGAGATSSNTTSAWSGSMRRKLGCAGSGAGAAMASVSSKTSSGGSGAG